MKVLLVNNQFSIGGAARVATVMCNELMKNNVELHIVTDNINWNIDYKLDNNVTLHSININPKASRIWQKFAKMMKCIKDIRKYIRDIRPDIIVAIQSDMYVRTLLANIGLNIPLVVADHTTFTRKQDRLTNLTRYCLYRYADGISILTHKDESLLGNKYPQKRVIYNPLSFDVYNGDSLRRKNILCVGRLDVWEIKGFDTIIKIWSKIEKIYPDWQLEIAGFGSESSIASLKSQIIEYGIEKRVSLLGHVEDMQSLYQHSSIFVLPSRVEGFPMALLEAMSQGCACLAFNLDGATYEMLDEECGIVVPDGDNKELTNGLLNLMNSSILRKKYADKAKIKCMHFTKEAFVKEWISYLNEALEKHYDKNKIRS